MSDTASTARHANGDAAVAPATVDLGTGVVAVIIENLDALDNVLVSFDGGTTFKTIKPGVLVSLNIATRNVVIKASANTPAYEILATVR